MTSAICGILGGGPDAGQALDALLDALADYGPERAARTDGSVRLGGRHAATGDDGAGAPVLAVDRGAGLVLRAFVRWGEASPDHLVGDYTFAVWDRRCGTLFCARDPVGARPFYYTLDGERFVFASAVEAVLAAPGVPDALDEAVVAARLSGLGPDMTSRTFYRAVRKLPAGHALTVEPEAGPNAGGAARVRVRMERYWRPEQAPAAPPASDDAFAEQLLGLYAKVVRDRLRGGPVGVHLSGGLDSSSVAVLAARELRRQGRPPPPAFSWLPALHGARPKPEHAREYALVDAVCA